VIYVRNRQGVGESSASCRRFTRASLLPGRSSGSRVPALGSEVLLKSRPLGRTEAAPPARPGLDLRARERALARGPSSSRFFFRPVAASGRDRHDAPRLPGRYSSARPFFAGCFRDTSSLDRRSRGRSSRNVGRADRRAGLVGRGRTSRPRTRDPPSSASFVSRSLVRRGCAIDRPLRGTLRPGSRAGLHLRAATVTVFVCAAAACLSSS